MNDNIVDAIRKLPLIERIHLVEAIWRTIAEDAPAQRHVDEADVAEFERRWEAHQVASEDTVPWDEARKKLKQG